MDFPILSPSSSGRKSSDIASPEFEFWMVRNPSFPPPNLLSADQLFSDGILLPLHHYHQDPPDLYFQTKSAKPISEPETEISEPSSELSSAMAKSLGKLTGDPPDLPYRKKTSKPNLEPAMGNSEPETGNSERGSDLSSAVCKSVGGNLTGSNRWKSIFKKGEKKSTGKEKKREKTSQTRASSAELNINIWPFSRSRSAGNSGIRRIVTLAGPVRKVSSAPCSRSNSAGESKSKKWPNSPGRTGVHLGRSSPVWQIKPVVRNSEKGIKKEPAAESRWSKEISGRSGGGRTKAKGLNWNVPMCIGYRQHLSCKSDESNGGGHGGVSGGAGGRPGGGSVGNSGGNLFNLRGLLNKKVY